MNETNAKVHLESCRERILTQHNLSQEHSRKAMWIATFALAALGVGVRVSANDLYSSIFVAILAVSAASICFLALRVIVRPSKKWKSPVDLSAAEDFARRTEEKRDPALYLMQVAYAYRKAAESNQELLDSREVWLSFMTWAAVVATVVLACIALTSL